MKKIILIAGLVFIVGLLALIFSNKNEDESSQKQQKEIEVFLPAPSTTTVGTKFVIYGKGRAFENTINYRISDAKNGEQLYLGNFMTNAPDAGIFGYFHQEVDLAKLLKIIPPVIKLDVLELSAKDGSDIHKTSFDLKTDQTGTAVFAYFNNSNLDPEISCNKTFAVASLVPKTQSVLRTAIEELLRGPAKMESEFGFNTSINKGTKLNSVKIISNTTYIDLSGEIESGGSCRVTAIRSQITNTAKQFPNVKNTIISVDGRVEDALQP